MLDNKELEREYNTVEALKSHPGVGKFVELVSKKPHGTVRRANECLSEQRRFSSN
jgi:hypothetical protein